MPEKRILPPNIGVIMSSEIFSKGGTNRLDARFNLDYQHYKEPLARLLASADRATLETLAKSVPFYAQHAGHVAGNTVNRKPETWRIEELGIYLLRLQDAGILGEAAAKVQKEMQEKLSAIGAAESLLDAARK